MEKSQQVYVGILYICTLSLHSARHYYYSIISVLLPRNKYDLVSLVFSSPKWPNMETTSATEDTAAIFYVGYHDTHRPTPIDDAFLNQAQQYGVSMLSTTSCYTTY